MQQDNEMKINDQASELLKQAKASYDKGEKLKKDGSLEQSLAAYKKAISIKPDLIQALIPLGEIYQKQKKWSEAAKYYRRVLSLKPNLYGIYVKLARTLKHQNKIYGAIAAFQEAIELKPDLNPMVYKEYGDLLLKVNDKNPDAIAAYQKAVELKPDWGAGFYNKFAKLLERKGKLNEATTYYLKALCLQADNPAQYLKVGNIYFKQKLLKQAAGNYQKALQLNPEFFNAFKRLGDLLKAKNQMDDA